MYPIRTMARVLKASTSGYYAWRSRPASARRITDAVLTGHIRTIHAGSHGTCGAPRVHAELKVDGLSVGRKRTARLMRAVGIAGVSRRGSAPIRTRQAIDCSSWSGVWSGPPSRVCSGGDYFLLERRRVKERLHLGFAEALVVVLDPIIKIALQLADRAVVFSCGTRRGRIRRARSCGTARRFHCSAGSWTAD